jgi:hypothetical protein
VTIGRILLEYAPDVVMHINGRPLHEYGLDYDFTELKITRTSNGLSTLRAMYTPDDPNLLDADVFLTGNIMDVFIGYSAIREMTSVWQGQFVITSSSVEWQQQAMPSLRIQAIPNGYGITRGEKQRAFQLIRDSDLAEMIAAENDLETTVDDLPTITETDVVFEQITQASESDFQMLRRRANRYGFSLFVDEGALHFRRPIPADPVIVIGENVGIPVMSFIGGPEPLHRGFRYRFTDYDPLTGNLVTEGFSSDENSVLNLVQGAKNQSLIRAPEDLLEGEAYSYLQGVGHRPSPVSASIEVGGVAAAAAFVVDVLSTIHLTPILRPLDVITVAGFGRFEGNYVISKLQHELSDIAGTKTALWLTRPYELAVPNLAKLLPQGDSQQAPSATQDLEDVELPVSGTHDQRSVR